MRKFTIPLAAFAVGVALLAAQGIADQAASALKVGDTAPGFALQNQDGKEISLGDYKGKVVVLEWFNNECPYVVKHYKSGNMNQVAGKYEAEGVVWLAINSTDGKTNADNQAIHEKWSMNHPVLNDSTGKVGKAYGATNTPDMYVIDKEGKIAYMGAIDSKPTSEISDISGATNYVSQAVDAVLAGETPATPKTKPYGCSVKYAE